MASQDEVPPRAKADPSVTVFDLEKAMSDFFISSGSRNVQAILDRIKESGVGWKSGPKVDPTI